MTLRFLAVQFFAIIDIALVNISFRLARPANEMEATYGWCSF